MRSPESRPRNNRSMIKNSEKIIFLFVVIGSVFFARIAYPNLSGVPAIASNDPPQTADAETTTAPPTLVLPQTSVNSVNATRNSGNNTTANDGAANLSLLPKFSSEAYMVADLTTGKIFAGSNVSKRWPTASLTRERCYKPA